MVSTVWRRPGGPGAGQESWHWSPIFSSTYGGTAGASSWSSWLVVLVSQLFYFLSLDLPKTIVNKAIQGEAF